VSHPLANVPAAVLAVRKTLGATPRRDGRVGFHVWSPTASSVRLRLNGEEHELARADDGVWAAEARAVHGDEYVYVVDGAEWPDPCSRWQPGGVRGPSAVVDLPPPAAWEGVLLADLVLYELHVGTFSAEGTFDGVVPRLASLRELGVTAIELMPVATFPGERGWGYDGLYTWAPHSAYGGPEGLRRLVAAAHGEGLGVVLDVVYNHVGPGNEALRAFGPYFTDRHRTFWGEAIDYSQTAVREWAIQNAVMWIRDYGIDGLRLDATHAVFDDSPTPVLAELADRVRDANPRALVTSEIQPGDLRPIEEWGHDAQWADELHHELHALLTGERDGYYADYGSLEGLAAQLERTPPERLIVCSQNHDQVGNRALGDRPRTEELRLRAAVTLFAPQTPLLFQGEEYGERRPFQFFTDHIDPAIAEATREGRRREFASFAAFAGTEVPDPQAREPFERSKLDPAAGDAELRAFYRELLALRRRLPREVSTSVEGRILRIRRGDVELVANFDELTAELRR
jgi:maltooligosyltrehalose trehalohydrolase